MPKLKARDQIVTIPHNYIPRDYQKPFWNAMAEGYKRAVLVWHRRCGKDKTGLNYLVKEMCKVVGSYYYFFPSYAQGRKILWEGMDKNGFRYLSHFHNEILASKPNDTEMRLEIKTGSVFRVIGTDNIDSIVGTNPRGCIFSEYSLQDPAAWDYIRPILAENGGWAIFNYTPRGENHGYQLYEMARQDPENWYTQVLTVDDTLCIPPEVLAQEKREILAKDGNDAFFQQEYYCSFKAPIAGAYYAAQTIQAYNEKRITGVPYERALPVDTYWDLGIDDSMSIWFSQTNGREVRFIDYLELQGMGIVDVVKVLKEKPYVYGTHYAPHDIAVRELTSGKSRWETAKNFGITFKIAQRLSIEDGIEAARNMFSRCWFDAAKCYRGINALKSYHKEYDELNKCYRPRPNHDWSSHAADAFRTFAVCYQDKLMLLDSTMHRPISHSFFKRRY